MRQNRTGNMNGLQITARYERGRNFPARFADVVGHSIVREMMEVCAHVIGHGLLSNALDRCGVLTYDRRL